MSSSAKLGDNTAKAAQHNPRALFAVLQVLRGLEQLCTGKSMADTEQVGNSVKAARESVLFCLTAAQPAASRHAKNKQQAQLSAAEPQTHPGSRRPRD